MQRKRRKRERLVPLGIFSTGTLHDDEVANAIVGLLEDLHLRQPHRALIRDWNAYQNALATIAEGRVSDRDYKARARISAINSVSTQEEWVSDVLGELWSALDDYLPQWTYAGAHPGDGAEYGVWPNLDAGLPRYEAGGKVQKDGSVTHPPAYEECYLVTDHGNVSCGFYRKNGKWVEYWSVV